MDETTRTASTQGEIQPQEIGHVVLRVRDLECSTPFYELLGFRKIVGSPT